jgi:hypothetical protein
MNGWVIDVNSVSSAAFTASGSSLAALESRSGRELVRCWSAINQDTLNVPHCTFGRVIYAKVVQIRDKAYGVVRGCRGEFNDWISDPVCIPPPKCSGAYFDFTLPTCKGSQWQGL